MIIIATVGINDTKEKTRKLLLSGANVIRINLSRHEIANNIALIKQVQETIDELHANTKILIDMPIKKNRLGDFNIKSFAVRENEEFVCKSASFTEDCNQFIPINIPKIGQLVELNNIITIGDGEIALMVTEIIDDDTLKIKILNTGVLQYMRTFNIKKEQGDKKIFDVYTKTIKQIQHLHPDYITISFLQPETNNKIRHLIEAEVENKMTKIILKIERELDQNTLDTICQDPFYHALLVDRGELGVNVPYEKVGIICKNIIKTAKKFNKNLFISTHILESTINNYTPYRAEISDLTEMVINGVTGILLCKETGNNSRPAYTIAVAKKIIEAANEYKVAQNL